MVKKRTPLRIGIEIAVVLLTIVTHIMVFYFMFVTASKGTVEARELNMSLPSEWHLIENIKYALTYQNGALLRAFRNSVILTVLSIAILVLVASSAAYILQRRTGLLGNISDKLILAGLIVPAAVVPTYWMLRMLHLANTVLGLTLVEVATLFPFAVMLYKGYITSVPKEIDEAAVIDGCGPFSLFTQVMFPIIRPITVTVVILRSIVVYNDFQNPLYYTSGVQSQTVQLFVYSMKSAWTTDYGHMFAAALLVSLPMIIMYIFLNQQILEGMTTGAVKG